MPKFKEKPDDKVAKKNQKTTPGLYIAAGEIEASDFDKKDWLELQQDYTEIENGDAMASTSLDILKYPLLKSERMIESGSKNDKAKEARDLAEDTFSKIIGGFQGLKEHKLLALNFGLSMHEVIVKRADRFNGKLTNRIVKLSPIQNETISKFYYDEIQEFTGIEHDRRIPDGGSSFVDIDIEKLEWFSFRKRYNDIRGRSILRPIRLSTESKKKIIIATVRGIQKGGMPVLYHQGEPSTSEKADIKEVGRTISNLNNPYLAMDETRMKIKFEDAKNQKDVMPLIEYFNKDILYNVLAQFVLSGIGQNGSRAATSEHKGTYELSATFILQLLEENFQKLTNRIIQLSYLGKIPQEDYPIFKLAAITQADLVKVAQNMKMLGESGIVHWTPKDEKYIREQYGLPIGVSDTKIDIENEDKEDDIKEFNKHRKLQRALRKSEIEIFELQSATNHYENMIDRGEKEIQSLMTLIMNDVAKQLKVNHKGDFKLRYFSQFVNKMMSLYQDGFDRGQGDMQKELKKILKTQRVKLTKESDKIEQKEKQIKRKVSKLYKDIDNTVKTKMESVSIKFIESKGGVSKAADGFAVEFKMIRRDILNDVTGAYIDGRGAEVSKHPRVIYEYTALMNKSTCPACASEDGFEYTDAERHDRGLNPEHPVNPECHGWDSCHCLWIPIEEIE